MSGHTILRVGLIKFSLNKLTNKRKIQTVVRHAKRPNVRLAHLAKRSFCYRCNGAYDQLQEEINLLVYEPEYKFTVMYGDLWEKCHSQMESMKPVYKAKCISYLHQLYQSRKRIEKVSTNRNSNRNVLLLLFRCMACVNSLLPSSTFFVASTAYRYRKIANS